MIALLMSGSESEEELFVNSTDTSFCTTYDSFRKELCLLVFLTSSIGSVASVVLQSVPLVEVVCPHHPASPGLIGC